ncbi:NADH-quinone oxidoreductase subunit NuoK [bacterium]|jgi:NADH-quinone oxidoreductase subunit K|nr:NADH-quinone oxidoreductase subunit NuoK [bacterium]NSX01892.1 NADH-quinone oxidoreductase subunit NuoK [Deltaproteobacteria bacterium TMED58]RZP16246.1 MAG: NADH-quinone oxidoreductase subunit NuoK [Candidatus Dadabacteria bacterium]
MFMSLIYTSLFISSIGIFMLLSKKHILSILIGIELFLNGINLFFITICKSFSDDIANIFILFILVITACEVAIGLAIFLLNQRINKTIDINSLDRLRDN